MSENKSHALGIVWFRRDLRLRDNPALSAALSGCERILPVYIEYSAEQGDWATGAAARWWLHHSLASLAADLADKDVPLILRRGSARDELLRLTEASGATAVYWNRLYEPARIEADKLVKKALTEADIAACSFNGSLLAEPWEIETKSGTPYRVFTPFWRAAREYLDVPEPERIPAQMRGPDKRPDSLSLDDLALLPERDWADGFMDVWTPGEDGARRRAERFVDSHVGDYDEQRDIPAVEGVSRMSPHLHWGEISIRDLWHKVCDRHDEVPDGADVYLQELGWREFAHHILYHYPQTTDAPMYEKYAKFPWREDADDMIRAWQRGRTGIPIVDAGMRQLWQTGWMHNRVRMIVASLLVKNIRAHWLHGARWFWDTLVDADLPANTMGWQWSAGSGADAAPYFRIFNPVRQGERFDPAGDYVRRWVPELADVPKKYIHAPWTLPADAARAAGVTIGEDYPEPIVDLSASREAALDALKSIKD